MRAAEFRNPPMNIQAKVALDKVKHPEFFCKHNRCLWRVVVCHPMTREMVSAPRCKDGYCPRHAGAERTSREATREFSYTNSGAIAIGGTSIAPRFCPKARRCTQLRFRACSVMRSWRNESQDEKKVSKRSKGFRWRKSRHNHGGTAQTP